MIRIIVTNTDSTSKQIIDVTAYTHAVVELAVKQTIEECLNKFKEMLNK